MSASAAGSLRRGSGPSRSSTQGWTYEERSVDPVEDRTPAPEPRTAHKADLKNGNGRESEAVSFLAEGPPAAHGCNPCSSPGGCRTFVCSVLTCGLYRVCQRTVLAPCLAASQGTPDEPERVSLRAANPGDNREEDAADWLGDVHIAGVKVDRPLEYLDGDGGRSPAFAAPPGARMRPGLPSPHESLGLDDWEDPEEDVDALIMKKLLVLYSEYQIEELARCTSDSVFLKKSKAINSLINSLAEEHKMDEQEAECRLVRGIIRISTRKSRRRPPLSGRWKRTMSDSGHETMGDSDSLSLSNNNDYKSNPNIQISELTSSDKCAREMWRNNGGHTSASPTAYSPSPTETHSSGVPLIHTSVPT